MTREHIEDFREIVLPFLSRTLLETNYENMGKSDAEEFARDFNEILDLAIKGLEQEPTPNASYCKLEDCVPRSTVYTLIKDIKSDIDDGYGFKYEDWVDEVRELPSVLPKAKTCKDCKWWKDKDGEYRRGCGAESKCPINRREVFEGNGYCYLYEPQESEG